MKRRRVLVAAALVPLVARAEPALPQRNLRVEWRWATREDARATDAGLHDGSVVVGTGGRVDARGGVVLRSRERTGTAEATQQLLVLNGGRAGISVGAEVPLQWLEVAVTPRGPVAALRQQWTEAGWRLQVQPRWPGGAAPVTVEVLHETGDGVAASRSITTLQLPLDQWTTVARAAQASRGRQSGMLRSQEAERSVGSELQLRVSLP